MLVLLDDNGDYAGYQEFPPYTDKPHIVPTTTEAQRLRNGEPVRVDSGQLIFLTQAEIEARDLPKKKAEALARINRAAQGAATALIAPYPEYERLTWPDQEKEARAWQADNAAPTPTLTPIAQERGLTMADLAQRVIDKANLFRTTAAQLSGKRQRLEDAIDAATTIAQVEAITWE